MNLSDFDYELPEELIAQTPLENRSESRLLVLDKISGEVSHNTFTDIINYLEPGDALVLNDTKVMPARLIGVKEETEAIIEVLLLKDIGDDTWECLVKPAKRVSLNTSVSFGDGKLVMKCVSLGDDGVRKFKLEYSGILLEILEELGTMPLPPYIHEKLGDNNRYQTVYAKNLGSAAAPTAGLHFTEELLESIKSKGINICFVTLHVGLGTFRPVSVDKIEEHEMHSEYYEISVEVADILNQVKETGKKIIAVGTTSVRVLETVYGKHGKFKEDLGDTNIFIYPGFKFLAVDNLITNFHLPKSTLMMLISALAGRDKVLNAYQCAVEEKYRFFSFGDSMLIR